tara:strand:+ start:431 stop:574 length:144 start_codon:yes stop_codon:yes gene_type:complete
MSEPNDPFNRQPLSEDQLVPQEALKAKIEQWLQEKRDEKKGKKKEHS